MTSIAIKSGSHFQIVFESIRGQKILKSKFLDTLNPEHISVLTDPTHDPLHTTNQRFTEYKKENNFNNYYI